MDLADKTLTVYSRVQYHHSFEVLETLVFHSFTSACRWQFELLVILKKLCYVCAHEIKVFQTMVILPGINDNELDILRNLAYCRKIVRQQQICLSMRGAMYSAT